MRLERRQQRVLQYATVSIPKTAGYGKIVERLWRRLGTGEAGIRLNGSAVDIALAIEMPERTRLTEAKIREALPATMRSAAVIHIAGRPAADDELAAR